MRSEPENEGAEPGAEVNPIDPLFIPETTVLFLLLLHKAGEVGFKIPDNQKPASFDTETNRRSVEALFSGHYNVMIPHHALMEIAGQFFHERIDLANYGGWYRARKHVFNETIIKPIMEAGAPVAVQTPPAVGLEAINRAFLKINPKCLRLLQNANANRDPNRIGRREPKFLDGMDAALVEEATLIAKEHPQQKCFFVTADVPLSMAFSPKAGLNLPKNLYSLRLWDLGYTLKKGKLPPKNKHKKRNKARQQAGGSG